MKLKNISIAIAYVFVFATTQAEPYIATTLIANSGTATLGNVSEGECLEPNKIQWLNGKDGSPITLTSTNGTASQTGYLQFDSSWLSTCRENGGPYFFTCPLAYNGSTIANITFNYGDMNGQSEQVSVTCSGDCSNITMSYDPNHLNHAVYDTEPVTITVGAPSTMAQHKEAQRIPRR